MSLRIDSQADEGVISIPVGSELYVILSVTTVERRIYALARDASQRSRYVQHDIPTLPETILHHHIAEQ